LKVISTTSEYKGLVFHGEGGIGKTVMTLQEIKNTLEPEEWEYKCGYSTPLALYETLCLNKDKKIIILDDVEGLFNNAVSLSILKASLWETDGKRIVQYDSKSDKAETASSFVLNAKIIILCNRIPKNKDASVRALMSRTITYEVNFSYAQKLKICVDFIKANKDLTEEQKVEVERLLKQNTSMATDDFNFRTLRKAIAFIKYDKNQATSLFLATTKTNEDKEAYLSVKHLPTIKDQIKAFSEITGKSRASYFRIKKLMKKESIKVSTKNDMILGTEGKNERMD